MRVSEFFKLGRNQPYLDFVDVRLDTDIEVFADPTAIRGLHSTWGQSCATLIQNYFETVLDRIKHGKHAEAQSLLSCLNERNEFHLGYSAGESKGHAFGTKSAETVWGALSKSGASFTGLLKDLEDTCLLIKGIDRDMISDAVCNIIRGPLIKYTQEMCVYYGIPLTPDVNSGPIWNSQKGIWESSLLPLPIAGNGKIILVPKIIVRHKLSYQYADYYNHYLLPAMQIDEIKAGTGLVHLLKDGTPKVTKKALKAKYGSNKLAVVEQTLKRPHVLNAYKDDKSKKIPVPLNHDQFAEIEEVAPIDWNSLITELRALPVGKSHATEYEKLIEKILTALFYPSLCNPVKQDKIHQGRKRIDITYTNEAKRGFFSWLSQHYSSAFIFVECKNYGKEIENPEIDQLAGRFAPSRGQVGFLICRNLKNESLLQQRCIDTAHDSRGFIISLTDEDVVSLINDIKMGDVDQNFHALRRKFNSLVK